MTRFKFTYIYLAMLFVAYTVIDSVFILREGGQALITQWGDIIRQPITNAGVHFKIPFIQRLEWIDKRILSWEGTSDQIPTGDQRYVSVRTVAQWRVRDFATFIQTAETIPHARARLDSIINGEVRNVVSSSAFVEVVRTHNQLLKSEEVLSDVLRINAIKEVMKEQHEVVSVIEPVRYGRSKLERRMLEGARKAADKLGVEVVALNIKQLLYSPQVKNAVFERMITERLQIAEKIRAVGRSEEARIRGRMAKDYQEIVAPAQRRAEEIRGEADAAATRIYGEANDQDRSFFRFLRTLDAYRESVIQNPGEFVLSSKSRFFRALMHSEDSEWKSDEGDLPVEGRGPSLECSEERLPDHQRTALSPDYLAAPAWNSFTE